VTSLRTLVASARAELPQETFARWASLFFTLSVLTIVVSLSASQAMLAAATLCYLLHLFRHRDTPQFPPIKLPLALFCLGTAVSLLGAADPGLGWYAMRKLVLFLILLLGANLVVSGKHLDFLFRGLFLASALAAVVATGQFIAQYRAALVLPPQHLYATLTSNRITGFMGHWMNFGGQQMLIYAALLAYLIPVSSLRDAAPGIASAPGRPARKLLWWLVWAMVVVSIVLNFTRGVWVGCFVATLYLVGRWKPRWLWLIPALVVVGYFAAPSLVRQRMAAVRHPESDPSLSIRLEMWQVAGRMIRKHPWLGVGPGNIEREYVLYLPPGKVPEIGYHSHLHNDFLQLGAERGLPVLAAWVWMMGALGWHFWRLRGKLRRERWVAEGALAGWLAYLAEGCFEFNFGTSPVLMLFLWVAVTPFAAERIEPRSGDEQGSADLRR
jgi:O-antigen ligase